MPIYEYRCKKCGYDTEIIHKADDKTKRYCNVCSEEMEKLLGPVAIIFKGSGFYKNDYSHGSSAAPARCEPVKETPKEKTETKTETTSSDTKKSDSKVA